MTTAPLESREGCRGTLRVSPRKHPQSNVRGRHSHRNQCGQRSGTRRRERRQLFAHRPNQEKSFMRRQGNAAHWTDAM